MMKKVIVILLALFVSLSAIHAAETTLLEKNNAPASSLATPAPAALLDQRFYDKEFSLSLGTGYGLTKGDLFRNAYDLNLNVGAQFFLTKYIGVAAELPFYQSKGVSVRELSGGPVVRVPLFDLVAPYAGPAVDYDWVNNKFSYYARAGLEFRPVKNVGLFGEGRYYVRDFNGNSLQNGSWSLNGGVRVSFK
jgi:opacity protein-like surface antigen